MLILLYSSLLPIGLIIFTFCVLTKSTLEYYYKMKNSPHGSLDYDYYLYNYQTTKLKSIVMLIGVVMTCSGWIYFAVNLT